MTFTALMLIINAGGVVVHGRNDSGSVLSEIDMRAAEHRVNPRRFKRRQKLSTTSALRVQRSERASADNNELSDANKAAIQHTSGKPFL
jgi:hypothetical protein